MNYKLPTTVNIGEFGCNNSEAGSLLETVWQEGVQTEKTKIDA